MPSPKKRTRSAAQTLAGVLRYASVALADEMEAALGFKSPESFKRHLLKALDEHAGFEKVLREWHERSHSAKAAKAPSSKLSKAPASSGRPQAARFDGGAQRKGQKRS